MLISKHQETFGFQRSDSNTLQVSRDPTSIPSNSSLAQATVYLEYLQLSERIRILEAENDSLQRKVEFLQDLCLMS
jgi:hypothetical protein